MTRGQNMVVPESREAVKGGFEVEQAWKRKRLLRVEAALSFGKAQEKTSEGMGGGAREKQW